MSIKITGTGSCIPNNIIENKDNFTEQEWKSLYKLSEETFVEETDSLKKGALLAPFF